MKHTRGPWELELVVGLPRIVAVKANHRVVADLHVQEGIGALMHGAGNSLREEIDANARLIAAAPDLLEVAQIEHALTMTGFTKATATRLGAEALEAYLSGGSGGLNHWRRQKREAAIAKAEGRS
jgi:hypothetical protein